MKIRDHIDGTPLMKNKNDMVNHPKHYNQGIEAIDYIESHKMDFNEGNVIKYVTRYKHKNGLEDLKKAKWYLDRAISSYTKEVENGKVN